MAKFINLYYIMSIMFTLYSVSAKSKSHSKMNDDKFVEF